MRRIAGGFLVLGAVLLGIGSLLTWATSEGGVPPRVESATPISEDGGWLRLISVVVALVAGAALIVRGMQAGARIVVGVLALIAVAWAFIVTEAVSDPAVLGDVGAWQAGPARPVMLTGVVLGGMRAVLALVGPGIRS
jgi:hypothetical protein